MHQSRLESFVEAIINVIIGAGVSLFSNMLIFPMVGFHLSLGTNLILVAWFTIISVARSYLIRRFFNAGLHNLSGIIAAKMK